MSEAFPSKGMVEKAQCEEFGTVILLLLPQECALERAGLLLLRWEARGNGKRRLPLLSSARDAAVVDTANIVDRFVVVLLDFFLNNESMGVSR